MVIFACNKFKKSVNLCMTKIKLKHFTPIFDMQKFENLFLSCKNSIKIGWICYAFAMFTKNIDLFLSCKNRKTLFLTCKNSKKLAGFFKFAMYLLCSQKIYSKFWIYFCPTKLKNGNFCMSKIQEND